MQLRSLLKRMIPLGIIFVLGIVQSGCTSTHPTSGQPISLLSWNIRIDFEGSSWARREPTIQRVLTSQAYDLILIQEASEFMIARYQAILPEHHYIVGERSDGHRGDQDWYEYMPIFYDPKSLTLVSHGSFWVDEDIRNPGGTLDNTKTHGRVVTWSIFKRAQTSQEFLIANSLHAVAHTHRQKTRYPALPTNPGETSC